MLGKFFSKINTFFNKNLLLYFTLLIAIIIFLLFGLSKLVVDQSIYAVFPKGKEFQEFSEIIKENNLNRQIVFTLNASKDNENDEQLITDVSNKIASKTKTYLTNFKTISPEIEEEMLSYFQTISPLFFTDEDYQILKNKIKEDSISQAVSNAFQKLSSPNGLFLANFISKDPLNLKWKTVAKFNTTSDSSDFEVENGITYKKNKEKIVFFANLNYDVNDSEKNQKLCKILEDFSKEINAKNANLNLDYFGTFLIANDNSQQINKDNSYTLIASVGLILLILIVYYRSFLTPFFFVIGPAFGGLIGLGMLGYFKTNVSGLSLATSAVLFGIVLDYSFHFFTHLKHSGSIKQTVKEITFPMLVGSFTTIAAFVALIFTKSTFLQDFGIFAVFCLSGTALFNLILLPTILHLTKFKMSKKEFHFPSKERFKFLNFEKKWKYVFLFIVALCTYFLFNNNVKFDADINNLSYHTSILKDKENDLTGLNPRLYKKIFLFAKSSSIENTKKTNFAIYQKLIQNKKNYQIDEIVSTAPFLIPKTITVENSAKWKRFWQTNRQKTIESLRNNANKVGFSESAFEPFEKSITNFAELNNLQQNDLLEKTGLKNLINTKKGYSLVTSVSIKKSEIDQFKKDFSQFSDVFILDMADLSSNLLSSVKDDFNFLLLFSSLMVFISLLVVYGRLELAIFTFLPMLISWVLILGLMTLFNVSFNFVNILIATIIFGLGDDYSIFVTDGVLQKYKNNVPVLKSYSSAIILSGVTTIIGTGVYFFAKHPAIHSIAFVSVVGISVILFVSVYIQPKLFDFLVTRRSKKKNPPMTIFVLIGTGLLYIYFMSGCIILYPFMLLVALLPVNKRIKQTILNQTISKLAKSVIYLGLHIKKDIVNKELLNFNKPSIIIANHASFLDILLVMMLSPKIIIMVKKWVYRSPFFGLLVRNAGYLYADDGPENNLEKIKERIESGYSVVIFPEGTRSKTGKINRFHKGAFLLAQELKVPIQPILIQGAFEVVSKNDMLIKSGELNLKILPRIEITDLRFGETYKERTKNIATYFKEEFYKFENERKDVDFLFHRIIRNFVLKGPVLEWYVRVKWRLEKKNFAFYDELIGERNSIVDLGCGYGYLSYFLHYRNENRSILGVDYDEEKITIAQNGFDKTENLLFEANNLLNFTYNSSDVFFINDVLHYLSFDNQQFVLEKCVENLNSNGLLIIRDGISNYTDRHEKTKLTEFFSTKILNFNKKEQEFCFFSKEDICIFALKHNLEYEMIDHSKNTSNVLFILKKK